MLLAWFVVSAPGAAEEPPETSAWRLELDAVAVKQFETSLDSGGDFDIDRYFLEVSARRRVGEKGSAGLSLSYGEDRYNFSGNSGFGGLDPWGKIRKVRIGAPLRYRHDNKWTFYGVPSLRYRAESGASLSESDTWGMLGGVAYRFSDRLTIGPGVGVWSDIENSTDVSPVLLIDWKINDHLSLETGGGLAASRGPGLSLKWGPLWHWNFRLSVRQEKTKFRLDKNGPFPNGLGRDESIPVALLASYKPRNGVELNLLGGVEFAGNLRLEDADGDRLEESDYDVAPFAGLLLSVRL